MRLIGLARLVMGWTARSRSGAALARCALRRHSSSPSRARESPADALPKDERRYCATAARRRRVPALPALPSQPRCTAWSGIGVVSERCAIGEALGGDSRSADRLGDRPAPAALFGTASGATPIESLTRRVHFAVARRNAAAVARIALPRFGSLRRFSLRCSTFSRASGTATRPQTHRWSECYRLASPTGRHGGRR